MNSPPVAGPIVDAQGIAVPGFSTWLVQAFRLLFDLMNHGTTAQRPTTNLYVAKPFWDDTLGYRISYNGAVWVRWDGVPV